MSQHTLNSVGCHSQDLHSGRVGGAECPPRRCGLYKNAKDASITLSRFPLWCGANPYLAGVWWLRKARENSLASG
jgi:hypothetical protein